MAARSKSTTNPIPWSSLLKPLAVALAWLLLPKWIFAIVALYAYFVPFFRPASLAPAFSTFLLLVLIAPKGVLEALYAAAVFALILGIKDLVIVNRKAAYQLLVLLLSFAGCLLLFSTFAAWSATAAFVSLAFLAALWFWVLRGAPERQEISVLPPAIAALLLFETGTAIFFLPISFFYQTALLFSASALLFEAATNLPAISAKRAYIWGIGYATVSLLVVLLSSRQV